MKEVTCTAPVNIAVIKYWGKRNTALNLPTNSSLSVTLSQDEMCSTTTIRASKEFTQDRFWLNGVESDLEYPRLKVCLELMRKRASEQEKKHSDAIPLSTYAVHICSENNFPTAAGLASSASGFACLVYSLAKLFDFPEDDGTMRWLSSIARQGSGSACRSLYGGYVAWNMGEKEDGSDSCAEQIATEMDWPELDILVCVVSSVKKGVSSTSGMQTTVATSSLLENRVRQVVPERMKQMREAILKKDFPTFAKLTMQDSNQFHAVCLDTYPPIFYLNDTSKAIITMIHRYNDWAGEVRAAYTFDAGPNAVVYLPQKHATQVKALVQHYFLEVEDPSASAPSNTLLPIELLNAVNLPSRAGGVKQLLHTKPGPGPKLLPSDRTLLKPDGLPLRLSK